MVQVEKFFYSLLILVLGVSAAFGITAIRPQAAHAAPQDGCSQSVSAVRVENNQVLVVAPAGQTWGVTSIGPLAVDIVAGTYTLDYVSYDSHSAYGDLGQDQEQWYVEGYYQGSSVFRSSDSGDVPADSDYVSGVLDASVQVPQLDSVYLRHVLEVDPTGTHPQSVKPVCVAFEPEAEPVVCDPSAGLVLDDSTRTCVCAGDLVSDNAASNGATSACECPDGSTASASDPTVCEEDQPSTPGVLGDSTRFTPDPEPVTPAAQVDDNVASGGQVLGESTGSLAQTGTDQVVVIATGIFVAAAALRLTVARMTRDTLQTVIAPTQSKK